MIWSRALFERRPDVHSTDPCMSSRLPRAKGLCLTMAFLLVIVTGGVAGVPVSVAYTAKINEFDECHSAGQASVSVLENSLRPANGNEIAEGSPITLSAQSRSPVTFAVASSQSKLSSPDIDDGLGSPQSEPVAPGSTPVYTYTFTSPKATATPGLIQWDASISSAGIPECAGQPTSTYTTAPHFFWVVPREPASPSPAPESRLAPAKTPVPPPSPVRRPVKVAIVSPHTFSLNQPTFTFRIDCASTCSGETYYEIVSDHGAGYRQTGMLDYGPARVSITDSSGGDQRFVHRYSQRSLHMLRGIIHEGRAVEIRIYVKVTSGSGVSTRTHAVVRVHV